MGSQQTSSVFRVARRLFTLLRIGCLVALAGAAIQLVIWNKNYDPRFYRFLGTPPGRMLAKVMRWPTLHDQPVAHKPLSEFTDEELMWKRRLEHQLRRSWPTHHIRMSDGTSRYVRILQRGEEGVLVREHFGGQGSLETTLPMDRIQQIGPYEQPIPEVTWRDVRFQMEYPEYNLIYFGHYTVLTDAPYFQVADSVQELERLREQYMRILGGLVRFPKPNQSLQVLFFTREEPYRRHQEDSAPELSTSAGYYSPREDRMVVYNQRFSEQADEIRQKVQREIEGMLRRADSPRERKRVQNLQEEVERRMRAHAKRETLATLRHEGVHHLNYSYGVHSLIHTENAWLIEGIAVYFEPETPGETPASHTGSLAAMLHQNRIPPLADLVAVRQPKEFAQHLPGIEPHEAYALSWSLFDYCMRPETRSAFLAYLEALQNPSDVGALMETPRIDRLASALGSTPEDLEAGWRRHIARL